MRRQAGRRSCGSFGIGLRRVGFVLRCAAIPDTRRPGVADDQPGDGAIRPGPRNPIAPIRVRDRSPAVTAGPIARLLAVAGDAPDSIEAGPRGPRRTLNDATRTAATAHTAATAQLRARRSAPSDDPQEMPGPQERRACRVRRYDGCDARRRRNAASIWSREVAREEEESDRKESKIAPRASLWAVSAWTSCVAARRSCKVATS